MLNDAILIGDPQQLIYSICPALHDNSLTLTTTLGFPLSSFISQAFIHIFLYCQPSCRTIAVDYLALFIYKFCHIWKFALVPASVCCSWYICLRFFLWIVSDVILRQYWRFDFVNEKGVKANDSLFDWSIRPMWHILRQPKCSNCILERKYHSHNLIGEL